MLKAKMTRNLVAAAVAALIAGGSVAEAAGVLTIGRREDSSTFDPINTAQNIDFWVFANVYDVLVRVDKTGTKLEPGLFHAVTGLTVPDFHLLVRLKVFNTERMNEAVFAFRRYEDASLRYTGIESHKGLTHYGLYDTVVAKE